MRALRVADDVLFQDHDHEAFLLHVASGRYFGLNRTGILVWRAIERGSDPEAALAETWPDVAVEVRRRDLDTVVGALVRAGLVIADDADAQR